MPYQFLKEQKSYLALLTLLDKELDSKTRKLLIEYLNILTDLYRFHLQIILFTLII